jgi:hypothetical protein
VIRVVNMIPNAVSGETNQDSEPNLAVNPLLPRQIAGSAFTPNPVGGASAPIFVSRDGGSTWLLNAIVPSEAGEATGDITLRFAPRSGNLYIGILRVPGDLRLNVLRTGNYVGGALATVLVDRPNVDQPYVHAAPRPGPDRVFVGDNDFAAAPKSATIDHSKNAGGGGNAGFTKVRLEHRSTSGQDGPPVRPVAHWDGTVYAAFYRWTAFSGTIATVDVAVVRDDAYATGPHPFSALVDPGDGAVGRLVATGRSVPWANFSQPTFGQERFVGSNITIAVDPWDSSTVWLAWADRVAAADYTLHVRRSTDRGLTWSTDLRTVTNATNPALAVTEAGVLGFLFQQLAGTGASQRWVTHLERTADAFATVDDRVLATVPSHAPAPTFIPYLGDYIHLLALGDDFYGIFSANNTPDRTNFPSGVTYRRNADFRTKTLLANDGKTHVKVSIDPFFVHATGQIGVAAAGDDVFAVAPNKTVQHVSATAESLGGVCVGPPVAVSWGPDRLDVFAAGPDDALHHIARDGATWGAWESLGGSLQPAPMRRPAVVAWEPGRLDVLAVFDDGALHHRAWTRSAWSPWESLGGVWASPPAAVSWAPGRIDVFVVGADGALYHRRWDGTAWKPRGWESLGGLFLGAPAAIARDAKRLDLFAVGPDRALHHKAWDGGAWVPSRTEWDSLGGDCTSVPAAVASAPDRIDVFVRGADEGLRHRAWKAGSWDPDWESLGGTLRGAPAVSPGPAAVAVAPGRTLSRIAWNGTAWSAWQALPGLVDY